VQAGTDVTWSRGRHDAPDAEGGSRGGRKRGASIEIIDLLSIAPLDAATI
jgi:pyruvate/2-oxoglutarate/acetoin dehydrogenase E1 component